jgi:protein-disulfide isomerase
MPALILDYNAMHMYAKLPHSNPLRTTKMIRPAESFMLAVPVNHSDHFLGPASAKVTVVEYGDFECPVCAQAYPAVNMLLKHFGDRMRFVFRHFPLREVHPHAELAAEAAEAAGAQHKFWHMHKLLFEHQSHLKASSLRQYAGEAELDLQRYDFEMQDHAYLQRIQEHIDGGTRSGVRATPAFFVNGVVQDVSFGFQHLQTAIDAALRA